MNKRKVIIIAAAVLLACLIGVILLSAPHGDGGDRWETSGQPTTPEDPTDIPQNTTVPVQPDDPTDPADPTDPTDPTDPAGTAEMTEETEVPDASVQPGDPTIPVAPTNPTVPEIPTNPTVPVIPTNPTVPVAPTNPTVPVAPTNPTVPVIPTNPTVPVAPTNPTVPVAPTNPTVPVAPTNPTVPVAPTNPTVPVAPTNPTIPVIPTNPTVPVKPTDPTVPAQTDGPTETAPTAEETVPLRHVRIFATREDGTPAPGAAVIATHRDGWQEYAPADAKGLAELCLPEGEYSVQILCDGQHGTAELAVGAEPVEKCVQLADNRVLYILLKASGGYAGDLSALEGYSALKAAIQEKYPDAVYITDRYDVTFRDGDALLSVEFFVEDPSFSNRYFVSEAWIHFTAFQQSITAWDMDGNGQEIDTEYIDGNMCGILVRNEYDYEYKNSVSVITESFYTVQKDWHFGKSSAWANPWAYGYTMENVLSNSSEQRTKAPGAGMKAEAFWSGVNATRFRDYLTYVEQMFPYVDLWMSGNWNEGIEQLVSEQ